ncbi:MAG: hypothetical protein LCI02_22310 [Proteobacteria bacterium]|nr:hypothetical protein [Pseudomonadota bacterium]
MAPRDCKRAWLLLILVMGWPLAALAQPRWSDDAARGRDLYFGSTAFAVAPQVAGASMPAAYAACARCHGLAGEGSREASSLAPDIRAPALRLRHTAHPEQALALALQAGANARGEPLAPPMPRYQPSAAELRALQAFWPWLGDENQPVRGVEPGVLRLGLVLDGLALDGPARAAVQARVRSGVLQEFSRANAQGGVHGRRLELVLLAGDAADATVLALVASAPPAAWRERLGALRLPSVAALDMAPTDAAPGDWQLPLLPSLQQQAQAALRALQATQAEQASAAQDCVRWWYDPLQSLHGPVPAGWHTALEPPPLAPGTPLCWAALASAADVDALRARLSGQGIRLVRLVELASQRAQPLDQPGLSHELVLPVPPALAGEAARQGVSMWQLLGQAAARSLIEALARSGRAPQPEALLAQFRGLTGFEPVAGAALSIGRTQGHGWRPTVWPSGPALLVEVPASQHMAGSSR